MSMIHLQSTLTTAIKYQIINVLQAEKVWLKNKLASQIYIG